MRERAHYDMRGQEGDSEGDVGGRQYKDEQVRTYAYVRADSKSSCACQAEATRMRGLE